ncbi:MAG: hypothetical protein AB1798_12725 [Spirochaetota bacterium]
MKKLKIIIAAMLLFLIGITFGYSQQGQTSPAPDSTSFSVENIVAELSIFLPPQPPAQQAQSSSGGGAMFRMMIPDVNPKLYLNKAQLNQLLPIFFDLKENPFPNPSKAKKIFSTVESILTKEQKAEWAKVKSEREKMIEKLRSQFGNNPAGTSQFPGTGNAGNQPGDQTRQQRQITPQERRERMINTLIKRMEDRKKELGG